MKHICTAAMLAAFCLAAPGASAQLPPHNAAKFAEVFAEVETTFGGRDGFQKAYEDARAEQARVEGALQLSLNIEARFRANDRADLADIYLKAGNGLRATIETLRTTFAKFDALDSPLDEARGRAAYDRVAAEHAALFQRPVAEQFEYSKTHPLTAEPLNAVQTATQVLIAIAERKPG
jgi:hypothetical protein